jgi:hypothetical protein
VCGDTGVLHNYVPRHILARIAESQLAAAALVWPLANATMQVGDDIGTLAQGLAILSAVLCVSSSLLHNANNNNIT